MTAGPLSRRLLPSDVAVSRADPAGAGSAMDLPWRNRVLDAIGILLGTILVAALAYRAWRETGQSNSYALLADAFFHGRLGVPTCFDIDCVRKDGATYVIFPPVPGVLAMPFVGVFGVNFAGFIALSLVLAGVAAWCWWRIAAPAGLTAERRAWFLAAVILGSPVFYLMVRGDRVWFFAQLVGFTLMSIACWAALVRRSALITGVCVGLAILTRQMAVLVVPAMVLFALPPQERLFVFDRRRLGMLTRFGAPIAAAIAVYLVYNLARFGNPLDTGYELLRLRNSGSFMDNRLVAHGTFSLTYLVQNLFYLLFQGFHAEFSGPQMTQLTGLDVFGTSLLAASPWLFALVLIRFDRNVAIAVATALLIGGITLFYHSNGYTQYNAQRYALDWLPLLFVFLPAVFARLDGTLFRALVVWSLSLNVVTLAVLQVTRAAT